MERKMKKFFILAAMLAWPGIAQAGCGLLVNDCVTGPDGSGYTQERNLGGSYNTYQNGSLYSQEKQTLGGGWRSDRVDGSTLYGPSPRSFLRIPGVGYGSTTNQYGQ